MVEMAQAFVDALAKAKLKPKAVQELENGGNIVVIGVSGKNTNYDVLFIFDAKGGTVSIRVPRLVAGCPEDKTLALLDAINDINAKYRWLKFYLNKDQNIVAQADAYANASADDNVCMKMLFRFGNIIDECYPILMHALWA